MTRRPMRFMRRPPAGGELDDDPLAGVANLFDASLAFVVVLIMALFSVFSAHDLFSPTSQWTLTRTTADGRLEVVRKDGRSIKVQRVTDQQMSGDGSRLGVAYELPNGQVIYVPEGEAKP